MSVRKCSLCLIGEREAAPFIERLRQTYPQVKITLILNPGTVQIVFEGETPDPLVAAVQKQFPTFFYGDGGIGEALHREFIARSQTLALAESCTGGAAAAKIVSIPGASKFFLGSLVAYSNGWKERFLHVSRSTIDQKGAASKEVAAEMVAGLLNETEADYGAAITGFAGPCGSAIYIAVCRRGEKIDAGAILPPAERMDAIDLAVHLTLGALWRRLVHRTATFS